MRLLLREWRPMSLVATVVAVLALAGWAVRFRVAVEVQFYAQDHHPAAWHLRPAMGPDEVSVLHGILVSDPDPKRRELAAHRLSREVDPHSVSVLTNALWDPDPRVAKSAYSCLSVHDDDGEAFRGWMDSLSDRQLLELVRSARDASMRWWVFLDILKGRRPLIIAAGEALAEAPLSVEKGKLSLLALQTWLIKDLTPQEKALFARLLRPGADGSEARLRWVCRSRVALFDATSLAEQELADWALDLASAEYHFECDDIMALLTEAGKRAPARFDETISELLATAGPSALPWKLLELVDGVSDPWRQASLLSFALQSPDETFREHAEFKLKHLDFRNEYPESPGSRDRK